MGCHGESIDDHHDHGITTGVWKVINKIHGQFRPDAIGHGTGSRICVVDILRTLQCRCGDLVAYGAKKRVC